MYRFLWDKPLNRAELLSKIALFPLHARGLAEEILAGDYGSVFKGQGIEFDEVRHYQAGDDIRSVDWNASARFGAPFVKMYREEKEMIVFILLDVSPSMYSSLPGPGASSGQLKPCEQGLLAAALIAFSASRTGQRVGALFFDKGIRRVFYPRKGRGHIMAILGNGLNEAEEGEKRGGEAGDGGSNLEAALTGAGRLLKRRSLVVIISDFYAAGWESEFFSLSRGHDLIAVRITSPHDREIPPWGILPLQDPETSYRIHALPHSPAFRKAWQEWHRERQNYWEGQCRRAGASFLNLSVSDDAAGVLFRFFSERKKK